MIGLHKSSNQLKPYNNTLLQAPQDMTIDHNQQIRSRVGSFQRKIAYKKLKLKSMRAKHKQRPPQSNIHHPMTLSFLQMNKTLLSRIQTRSNTVKICKQIDVHRYIPALTTVTILPSQKTNHSISKPLDTALMIILSMTPKLRSNITQIRITLRRYSSQMNYLKHLQGI